MTVNKEIKIKSDFVDVLKEKYLSYALSTITDRALPDVRDGLKPVHRRLLYAMSELKLGSENSFKKCARVVGDVIGKYHPHGEQAVYDALVKLAQDFSHRYPLIQGQGNFGNIDGDNPAAMRYTESRLTYISELIMEKMNDKTIDFVGNYDESEFEPKVFPSSFPNLLANGSSGIAVGMATNIPPHNILEILNMALKLIENRDISDSQLMSDFFGPDFPTGGLITSSREEINEIYSKGRGTIKLRCRWEEIKDKSSYSIKITEIPFGIQKSKLIEKLADCVINKSIPEISDIRDESDEKVCIIIKPKNKDITSKQLMSKIFQLSDLEISLSINMNVLQDGDNKVPKVLSIKNILEQWLDHRHEMLIKSNQYYLERAENRIHNLEGYLVVYLNMDRVIAIIRNSDSPKDDLITAFELSERQADSILDMKLRSLRKLEELVIKKDLKNLMKERNGIKLLLGSKIKQKNEMINQIIHLQNRFHDNAYLKKMGTRLTGFEDGAANEYKIDQIVSPVTLVLTDKGWLKTFSGHEIENQEIKIKDGDSIKYLHRLYSNDRVLLFSNYGKAYSLYLDKVNLSLMDYQPIRRFINLDSDEEIIELILDDSSNQELVMISVRGKGLIVEQTKMFSSTKNGKRVMRFTNTEDYLKLIFPIKGSHIAMFNSSGNLLVFNHMELKRMTQGSGIIFQRVKTAEIVDAKTLSPDDGITLISVKNKRSKFQLKDLENYIADRGRVGKRIAISNIHNFFFEKRSD
ncbi:MAG: DNA topoisomerase IV subunit A [Alphaproteobacteria bacterium]|uniref:DNA topoisomerase IV subunit A n=1 Tax=PS1 clade bacterium TaxID=2175152 RepID=A0A368DMP4_9PROT|nr:DNA topoisomerase IV subunit A [Rhodobiaceae bacterium]OUT74357.1 MAG: DNA topoisomerase IV subunit A [Rhizobiales bacterium TMED25]RCL73097.1 MAG: DNA topoisomerase IV subunit A [PS1 clade bacterium]